MGHRRLFFPSQTSDMDYGDIWNYPHPNPHLQLDATAFGRVNTMPYFDITMRSSNIPLSNFNLEIPFHRGGANPGRVHDQHPSSASGSFLIQPNYFQGGHPCYNQFGVMDPNITVDPHMDYGRATFKRKNPGLSTAFDRGHNGYSAESSSTLSITSAGLRPNPISAPQHWDRDFTNLTPSYGSNNLLTCGEGSQRNVRSRQVPSASHPHSNLPHHLYPTANISGLTAVGQWNHTPEFIDYHRRIPPSDAGGFNYEMDQPLAGNNCTSMEIDMGYPHNHVHNSLTSHLPTLHCPPAQIASADSSSSYGQRTNPYRDIASYQPIGFAGTLDNGRQQGSEAVPPSRYPRPVSIIGRGNERRSRSLYERFQPVSYRNTRHGEWESEFKIILLDAMVEPETFLKDRLNFYDSRNLFDQHEDMRLDIENMSYEELLALEERIGNVSTGLSEDKTAKCLLEIMYRSLSHTQDNQETNCVICLEAYKDREILGMLTCGHDFHVDCIKKWLSIKNACPICKASALPDTLKEK